MTRPNDVPEDVWAAAPVYKGPAVYVREHIARAILAERERAAKVAEAQAEEWTDGENGELYLVEASACLSVAAAIRAGTTP